MKRWMVAAVLLVTGLSGAACGSAPDGSASGGPAGDVTADGTSGPDGTSTTDDTSGSDGGPATPGGEIWQWALGRSLDDPQLRPYTANLDQDEANVQPAGFQLFFGASGTVTSVTLFNDEAELGLGAGSSSFSAYPGTLPGGLEWTDTARDVVEALGEPDESYTTGYGVEASFSYADWRGYDLEIRLAARHQADLWTSPMHCITVTQA